MASLKIRNMNHTLAEMERIKDERDMREYIDNPPDERSHYWHLQRKAKRGSKWIYVRDLYMTKREVAKYFVKYFRDGGQHRLHHIMAYHEPSHVRSVLQNAQPVTK